MATLIIDGISVTVNDGLTVLDAARQAGIAIPTLCHHPALEPYGGCRLCVVDVTHQETRAWSKMVVSCIYPAQDGLIVDTRSERVLATRAVIVDLLLARSPDTKLVQDLAREHGITQTSFTPSATPSDCVLCTLCTRACEKIGAAAISTLFRGSEREVGTPFLKAPPDCVGCLACAHICPTGYIEYTDNDHERAIWGKSFTLLRCQSCGRAHLTREQGELLQKRHDVPASFYGLCDACKRSQLASTAARLGVDRPPAINLGDNPSPAPRG